MTVLDDDEAAIAAAWDRAFAVIRARRAMLADVMRLPGRVHAVRCVEFSSGYDVETVTLPGDVVPAPVPGVQRCEPHGLPECSTCRYAPSLTRERLRVWLDD